jgi:hypothetical protein
VKKLLSPSVTSPVAPFAGLGLLALLAILAFDGCAHSSGGGAGGGGGAYFDDCGYTYGAVTVRHRFGRAYYYGLPSYDHPCGWYGWAPDVFLQTPESAAPARAQIAGGAGRRPHPRLVGPRGDGGGSSGFGFSGSGASGSDSGSSASSSSGSSVHLSQPSPTFSSSPPAPAGPPAPVSPPSSRQPN